MKRQALFSFVTVMAIAGSFIPSSAKIAPALTAKDAQKISVDSYLYGYSLMTSLVTKEAFINVTAPSPETFQAPVNQFVNIPKYPAADYKGVTAPNADTLYSAAMMDVSKEPLVLSYPDMKGRYFLFPIYDLWTNVMSAPGKRTLGTGAQAIAITGPGWKGTLPKGITQQVKSTTGVVFTIGRVYAEATEKDYAAVHALQKQFTIVPLSSFGKPYTPPAGTIDPNAPSVKKKVRDIIAAMDPQTYFNTMAKTMGDNPPIMPQDTAIVAEMAKIGLVPGKPFEINKLDPEVQNSIAGVAKRADALIAPLQTKGGKVVNGWMIPAKAGTYGTNYLDRAGVSAFGWGANLKQDAVYPIAQVDSTGAKLSGANSYTVHFAKGQAPPAQGFWSITMYDSSFYFYPNPLNKLTVSLRNHPVFNADGSLDLYFSHVKPTKAPQANWLPAPAANFILMMRLYWPKSTPPSIVDGTWSPPPIVKMN